MDRSDENGFAAKIVPDPSKLTPEVQVFRGYLVHGPILLDPPAPPANPANTVKRILVRLNNEALPAGYPADANREDVLYDITDPDNPAPVLWRLYLSTTFTDYIEFQETDVVHSQKVASANAPLEGTVVWLREGARIEYVRVMTLDAQRGFLQGGIANTPGLGGLGLTGGAGQGGLTTGGVTGGLTMSCTTGGLTLTCTTGGLTMSCTTGGLTMSCTTGGTSFVGCW